jgi:hypothetical protein
MSFPISLEFVSKSAKKLSISWVADVLELRYAEIEERNSWSFD